MVYVQPPTPIPAISHPKDLSGSHIVLMSEVSNLFRELRSYRVPNTDVGTYEARTGSDSFIKDMHENFKLFCSSHMSSSLPY